MIDWRTQTAAVHVHPGVGFCYALRRPRRLVAVSAAQLWQLAVAADISTRYEWRLTDPRSLR